MSDLDKLKDKYDKKDDKASSNVKNAKALTKELETKKDSAPVRAVKQAVSGFRSQWSGIDDEGKVGIGKGTPGIYYNTVAIPAMAGLVDDKYAPDFAVEADKKAGKIREAVRKDMGIDAPKGALEHFAQAGGEMLAQLPVPGAWLNRVLSPVKSAGVAGKIAASPVEYLSPIVDPKKINYGVGTGFGGTIGTVGEMLEEPTSKALGGLIQKYETGGKVGQVKSFFSAIDKAIDTLKQKKGTGEQILKEIEKAPGVKKEELELRKIPQKLKDKKSITQEEVKALAAETPAPGINTIVKAKSEAGVPEDWQPMLSDEAKELLEKAGIEPVVNPYDRRVLGFQLMREDGLDEIVDQRTIRSMSPEDFNIDGSTFRQVKDILGIVQNDFNRAVSYAESKSQPKFEKYTTPGGENYREILLQVDRPRTTARDALGGEPVELSRQEAAEKIGMHPNDFSGDATVLYYPSGAYIEKIQDGRYMAVVENRDKISRSLEDVESFVANAMSSELGTTPTANTFRGGHFDEPDVVVHARVTDRTGPNGEKVLYVEEIQSDWHQAARRRRDEIINDLVDKEKGAIESQSREMMERMGLFEKTRENAAIRSGIVNRLTKERRAEISKELPKDEGYSKSLSDLEGVSADDVLWEYGDRLDETQKSWLRDFIERWELDVDGSPAGQAAQQQLSDEYENWLKNNSFKGVPDAPWKNTANELAVKQILDVAAKEGYDTVAFSPGSEHVKRYGMSQYFDALTATKEPNGQVRLIGTKEGRTVVDKTVDEDALSDYIGKEKAENIVEQLKQPPPRNEAAEELRSYFAGLQQKYGDQFPTTILQKVTPEEEAKWTDLFERSKAWEKENEGLLEKTGGIPRVRATLTGQDLELTSAEGAGKKKIYDEIIPNYVRKYAKKEFGAEPGEVEISVGTGGKSVEQYLDEINADPYRHFDEDEVFDELHERVMDKAAVSGYDFKGENADDLWDQMMTREGPFEKIWHDAEQEMYLAKAKELAEKDPGEKLRAFAVPVTPQMREKITSQGQPLFSVAAPVGLGAAQGQQAFDPEGEDYDYETAKASGMAPEESGENQGHWGSVTRASEEARKRYGLPEDSYMLLKGRKHETWNMAEDAEKDRGAEIIKRGDRYFSVPKGSVSEEPEEFETGGRVGKVKDVLSIIGSKIKSGQPIEVEVFHGSPTAGIEKFKKSPSASSKGLADSEAGAFWATSDKQQAKEYSLGKTMENQFPSKKQATEQGEIYNVLTSLKNPLVLWDDHYLPWDKNKAAHIDSPYTRKFALDYAKKNGHDGVVFANKSGKKREVSRFEIAVLPDDQGEYPGVIKKEIQNLPEEPQEYETGGRVGKAKEVIEAAMRKAGQKKGQVTDRNLTTLQDFHTSLGDAVRARAAEAQKQMDSWKYEYEPGQYVFTEHSVKKNLPPLKIIGKSRVGWDIVREDPNDPLSKKVIDPETGRAKRTPYEPGYKVRREIGDDWAEFTIPASAIKGSVEPDEPYKRGGPVGFETGGRVGKTREAAEKLLRVLHGSPSRIIPESGRAVDVTTDQGYAVKRGTDKMLGQAGPPMVNKFDIPASRLLRFEEQYSPADVALMKRFFNKLPGDTPMTGEEIYDLAQGRDVVLDGIAKAGGFAGYERPNTGAVGKGQWFRITEPEEMKKARKRGGLA